MIRVRNLSKHFEGVTVLENIDLSVERGEMLALIGKSGTGKSVLLKNIAGLFKPEEGSIRIEDEDICSMSTRQLRSVRKKFGYLFQEGALFDSCNVYDNVAFPLRETAAMGEERIAEKVAEELERMGMEKHAHKFAAELSGGMRRRAALARALITEPAVMLFDEPTTGLDPVTGRDVLEHIAACRSRGKFTGIVVTHDVPRIFDMVDRVAMLHERRIIVEGTPDEVRARHNREFDAFCNAGGGT